jgi:hypothetical protein
MDKIVTTILLATIFNVTLVSFHDRSLAPQHAFQKDTNIEQKVRKSEQKITK